MFQNLSEVGQYARVKRTLSFPSLKASRVSLCFMLACLHPDCSGFSHCCLRVLLPAAVYGFVVSMLAYLSWKQEPDPCSVVSFVRLAGGPRCLHH